MNIRSHIYMGMYAYTHTYINICQLTKFFTHFYLSHTTLISRLCICDIYKVNNKSNSYSTHTLGLYLIYKCDAQGQSIYKSDTNWMDVLQLFCLWCVSGLKVPLCCWHKEEQLYTTGPMPEWCKWCCDGSIWFHSR